jgi:hypothetical protein
MRIGFFEELSLLTNFIIMSIKGLGHYRLNAWIIIIYNETVPYFMAVVKKCFNSDLSLTAWCGICWLL